MNKLTFTIPHSEIIQMEAVELNNYTETVIKGKLIEKLLSDIELKKEKTNLGFGFDYKISLELNGVNELKSSIRGTLEVLMYRSLIPRENFAEISSEIEKVLAN